MSRVHLAPFLVALLLLNASPASAEEPAPSFLHGLGQMVIGVFWEPVKGIVTGTMDGPPVVGTLVGAFGGIAQGARALVSGTSEMFQAGRRRGRTWSNR